MNDFLIRVLNYGFVHGIAYEATTLLSPVTPCAANPYYKRIVINLRFHNQSQLPFQAAHEIQHVLNHDEGVLYFHPTTKCAMEAAANRGAVDILVPMYFDGIDPEDANVTRFMDAFAIPGNLTDTCTASIRDWYAARS